VNNYYVILKIDQNASKSEIKRAFRVQAQKWHPDRNISPDASQKMQLINEAYLILGDDEARTRYDQVYKAENGVDDYHFSGTTKDYSHNSDIASIDDILNEWIAKAKVQAKSMAKESLDDLLGISKAAFRAGVSATFKAAIRYIFLLVIFIVSLMLLRE
jgi:DnaJ-class molecular chaperone